MKTNQPGRGEAIRRARRGATLVEVMIACVVLMVMAVGGAAYLYQSCTTLAAQRNKRIALEAGNARVEEIRATRYTDLKNLLTVDYAVHYLRRVAGAWQVSSGDPNETVNINGTSLPMTTTVQFLDIDGGVSSYDGLAVTVSTAYRAGIADRVILRSIYAP